MQCDAEMRTRKKSTGIAEAEGVTRITVSVPNSDYEHLQRVAASKRVSISWVVRDAIEKCQNADMPLFSKEEKQS